MILHNEGKEILIQGLCICLIVAIFWAGLIGVCTVSHEHTENMTKMGYEKKPLYDLKGKFEQTEWIKSGGPIMTIHKALTHEKCIEFLKKEIGENDKR